MYLSAVSSFPLCFASINTIWKNQHIFVCCNILLVPRVSPECLLIGNFLHLLSITSLTFHVCVSWLVISFTCSQSPAPVFSLWQPHTYILPCSSASLTWIEWNVKVPTQNTVESTESLCHSLSHWPPYQHRALPVSILATQDSFQEWAKSTSSTSWIRMKQKAPKQPTMNHAATTNAQFIRLLICRAVLQLCALNVKIWDAKTVKY